MSNAINGLRDGASRGFRSVIHTEEKLRKGLLHCTEKVAYVFCDLSTLNGLTKLTKFCISNARLLTHIIPTTKKVFAGFLVSAEGFKDILYATMILDSIPDFVDVKTLKFKLPKIKAGKDQKGNDRYKVDYVKVFYGIGNLLETLKFLQKKAVYSFPLCSKVGRLVGNVKVFSLNGKTLYFKDIPVAGSVASKPKEVFIFAAVSIETWRWLKPIIKPQGQTPEERKADRRKQFEWYPLAKQSISFGKGGLILFSKHHAKTAWFAALDFFTQTISLGKLIYDCDKARKKRFESPAPVILNAAAPAA